MKQQIYFKPINRNFLVLPIQYNHMIQGMIYDSLKAELADFLHEKGFSNEKRSFKMFTFSRLIGDYTIDKNKEKIIFNDALSLVISSPYEEFCSSLATGLLVKKSIRLGDTELEVVQSIMEKETVKCEEIRIQTLSPIVAYSTFLRPDGRKYTCYFEPGESYYNELIENNLRKKYEAFYKEDAPEGGIMVKALHKPKLSVINYKQTIIKGYSGKYALTGPMPLLQMAVDSGLGSKNSQGFGCIELIKN